MITRFKIKDYMAHKDTELEMSAGVTVLTGPNNSGKSAVVEALPSVAQNPPPHHVIRHGATQAVVRVELDSGEAIEWVRSRGNTMYRLFKSGPDADSPGDGPEIYQNTIGDGIFRAETQSKDSCFLLISAFLR